MVSSDLHTNAHTPHLNGNANGVTNNLHVVIIGAGIGGLSCAIACRRAKPPLQVTVLERAPEILTIGAGIHIPPNACRVMESFGLLDKLKALGGYEVEDFTLRRYQDGRILAEKPMRQRMRKEYGSEWIAIHRGDYQNVLLDAAADAGATIYTDAEMTSIEQSSDGPQQVVMKDGRRISADVVIGADGLWSLVREMVLERPFPPVETGDLAYRGTFTRDQLKAFKDERIDKLLDQSNIQVHQHCVFYPLRNHTEYNLVALVMDDLPQGVRTSAGNLEEMRAGFRGWDPMLNDILSCLKNPLKWKLLHFTELDKWTKGTIALLGDASHPTLPYQGQGAAMAVEDGAILGSLLSRLRDAGLPHDAAEKNAKLTSLLKLYEDLRKKRTETNVLGAIHTRHYYHLADGEEQQDRDLQLTKLAEQGWQGPCSFNWGDAQYQKRLLGFDVLMDAERRFDEWFATTGSANGVTGSRSTL